MIDYDYVDRLPILPIPDMGVRIWNSGTAEVVSSGSSDACVDIEAFDGRVVQIVFRNEGHIMVRGWCGTYQRLQDEAELDLYSRGEMGDETISFHGELPPVPNPVREARDTRLAALREQRAKQSEISDRKRHEAELRKLADELGFKVTPTTVSEEGDK